MKGLILINAYPNGEKFYTQAERIAQELRLLGCPTDVKRNGEVFVSLDENGRAEDNIKGEYSFIVYLDKDKYLGRALESCGYRLFNSAAAVEVCDDKLRTYFALQGAGLTLAESISAPLCYTPNAKVDEVFLHAVAEKLDFPLVVKKSYGSFGAGVRLVHGIAELVQTAQEFLHEPHFYQRYIAQSTGKDIRVIVVGGKAVAAMERVAQEGEFRSNVELGGKGRAISQATFEKYAPAAEQAAKWLGLDYCGVDLLETEAGAVVCEVNSNAFFEGIEGTTGVNVAREYAKHILRTIQS